MISLNIFLFMVSRNQGAGFETSTNNLSVSLASERVAWEFVDNVIQFNDSELFNPEIKYLLDLESNNTPLLAINGKQCQTCIDVLLNNLLNLEDSLELVSEIKFVFITASAEESNNVNYLGKYFQKAYFIDEEQLTSGIEMNDIPGVFLVMADYNGRIKSFCEFDVNYSDKFVNYLFMFNEKYYKQQTLDASGNVSLNQTIMKTGGYLYVDTDLGYLNNRTSRG